MGQIGRDARLVELGLVEAGGQEDNVRTYVSPDHLGSAHNWGQISDGHVAAAEPHVYVLEYWRVHGEILHR